MQPADIFLKEILAHPDDDTPRLVFADWLDEQGDAAGAARAEFIRLQCQTAMVSGARVRLLDQEMRHQELLRQYAAEWAAPLSGFARDCRFQRGFVAELSSDAAVFLNHADKLFKRAPVQHLRLTGGLNHPLERSRIVPLLAECPHLARLISLNLSNNDLGSTGMQALAVSEHLTRLTTLALQGNHIGDGGVRALVQAPWFAQLTDLNLSHNDIGPAGIRSLAARLHELAAEDRMALRFLDLRRNKLQAAGTQVIARSPVLRGLAQLS
jgi:uncharacterized protein (TIGR02996 family)